ncbi:hypothetical protein WCD74_03175 [Actinomycetospora sp. OC33-EN08]|uniref:Uncharacterized protein n=1 Tax=Actinomycetospora aurantiaca TaxID=3129233 RepID=A0ABU8MHI3_9PSEU
MQELQHEERQRRAAHPELALRLAIADLVSGCARQYYADHALSDDLARLDAAHALLDAPGQYHSGTRFETASLETVGLLVAAIHPRRDDAIDLDAEDELRREVVDVPSRTILGRSDQESPGELLCWNEATCLLESVTVPFRCASAVSGLGFLGAPDRFGLIDPMVDLARRYEAAPDERGKLDDEIRESATTFVEWFAAERGLVRGAE